MGRGIRVTSLTSAELQAAVCAVEVLHTQTHLTHSYNMHAEAALI